MWDLAHVCTKHTHTNQINAIWGITISPIKFLMTSLGPTLCYNAFEPYGVTKLALISIVMTRGPHLHL